MNADRMTEGQTNDSLAETDEAYRVHLEKDHIREFLDRTLDRTDFENLGDRYQGKVRDTYRRGNELVLITTDRISSFDHVLPQCIPFKGQILN
jgi:phosphoribosylaminoimidazole-succinocarboxamide synthase